MVRFSTRTSRVKGVLAVRPWAAVALLVRVETNSTLSILMSVPLTPISKHERASHEPYANARTSSVYLRCWSRMTPLAGNGVLDVLASRSVSADLV